MSCRGLLVAATCAATMAFAAPGAAGEAKGATFYVDGAAAAVGDGSRERPWRTAQEAVAGVRAARKAGTVAKDAAVTVLFAPGAHFVGDGVALDGRDSGASEAAPVVWRSADPKNRASLVGGRRIPADAFKPVADAAILARLPEEARGKVFVADVAAFAPEKIPELAPVFHGTPSAPLLFCGRAFATLARWPNQGWTSFTNAVDRGDKQPGAFSYSDPRAKRWNFDAGVWMTGYWTHDWDCRSVKAARYGAENGTNDVVRLAAKVPYGVMGGHTWGFKSRRFYVFNLLDELDAPGEWWLDRANKKLYFCPPGGSPADTDEVVLSFSAKPIVRANGVAHLRFEGLSFEYGAGNGVEVRGSDVRVEDCGISCVGGTGLTLRGDRNVARGLEVREIGRTGVLLDGGSRKTLTKAETVVENCHVHDWAHYQRTYAPAIQVYGCGMTVRGNRLHDAPHTAVLYGGNEHLFESNEVWRVLWETGDAGAFYTGRDWTSQGNVLRFNYVHDVGRDDGSTNTAGFYFDDCDSGDEVTGNVFHRVPRGILLGGGRDLPIRNNVFSQCQVAISMDARGLTWKQWNTPGDGWNLEEKAKAFDYTNGVWAAKYPHLAKIMQDHPQEPLYTPIEGNVFVDCPQKILSLCDMTQFKEMFAMRLAPIRNNVVIYTRGTNEVPRAELHPLVSGGFRVIDAAPKAVRMNTRK